MKILHLFIVFVCKCFMCFPNKNVFGDWKIKLSVNFEMESSVTSEARMENCGQAGGQQRKKGKELLKGVAYATHMN